MKFKLGIVLEGYNVNLYKDKHGLEQQFFDVVGGNAFRSPSERAIIVDERITDLLDKHNGWDNFHHEAPVVAELYSYVPDQTSILDSFAFRLFKVVMMCRIGNGVSYREGVSPGGRKYYDQILALAGDKFAPHIMASLSHFEVSAKLGNPRCRTHAKNALAIVRSNVINARIIECLDFLIDNIETKPSCVDSTDFKKLSASYINWS